MKKLLIFAAFALLLHNMPAQTLVYVPLDTIMLDKTVGVVLKNIINLDTFESVGFKMSVMSLSTQSEISDNVQFFADDHKCEVQVDVYNLKKFDNKIAETLDIYISNKEYYLLINAAHVKILINKKEFNLDSKQINQFWEFRKYKKFLKAWVEGNG